MTFLQQYEVTKVGIPEESAKKIELGKKLNKYGVSLTQYDSALRLKEIKP